MKQQLVNEQIRSATVILITSDGANKGTFSRIAATNMARAEGLDLVQVGEGAPPICKIADYGKMKFDASKAEKKKHHSPVQKEMWCKLKTETHDMDIKMRKVSEWLKSGHKVRFVMELEGREKSHTGNFRALAKEKIVSVMSKYVHIDKALIKEGEKEVSIMLDPGKLIAVKV